LACHNDTTPYPVNHKLELILDPIGHEWLYLRDDILFAASKYLNGITGTLQTSEFHWMNGSSLENRFFWRNLDSRLSNYHLYGP